MTRTLSTPAALAACALAAGALPLAWPGGAVAPSRAVGGCEPPAGAQGALPRGADRPSVALAGRAGLLAWRRVDAGRLWIEAAVLGPAGWGVPRRVSARTPLDACAAAVAPQVLDSGAVAWSDGTARLARRAGAGWQAPVALTEPVVEARQVRAAPGLVAWQAVAGGQDAVQAIAVPASGDLPAPDVLAAPAPAAEREPAAAAGGGRAVVAWRGDGGQVLAAVREPGGSWGAPEVLAPGGAGPAAAAGADGTLLVAWASGDAVVAAVRAPGAGWGPPATLAGGGAASPAVAVGAGGRLVAAWVRAGRVEAATGRAAGPWGTAAPLGGTSSAAGPPRVAAAGARAAVTWITPAAGGATAWAATTAGAAWTTRRLARAGAVGTPAVAVDAAGTAVAAWAERAGGRWALRSARATTGARWARIPLPPAAP